MTPANSDGTNYQLATIIVEFTYTKRRKCLVISHNALVLTRKTEDGSRLASEFYLQMLTQAI